MTPLRRILSRSRARPRRGRRRPLLLLLGLVVAALALTRCTPGVELDALLADFGTPVSVSEASARSFFGKVARAAERGVETRRVSLLVTDEEATSALALSMEVVDVMQVLQTMTPEQAETMGPDRLRELARSRESVLPETSLASRIANALNPRIGLRDAQVRFLADGRIVVGGYIHAWRWRQPALMVVAPRARSGSLDLDFVHGRLGRIPAPEWLFDRTGALVASVLLMGQSYAEITELSVTEGRLSFRGAIAPGGAGA